MVKDMGKMKKRARMTGISGSLAAVAALAVVAPVSAQTPVQFPTKPVRFIVPFPPGGGADVIGRVISQRLTEKWGQQLVIDNRAGAGGNIAAELAAAAPPDGHTLFQFNIANAISPGLYKKLNYDPVKDFNAVTLLATSPFVLVTHPSVKAATVQELIVLAKSQPGKLIYASSGNGGPSHLSAEMLKSMAGIQMTHVPYKGGAPAMVDLIAGQVQVVFSSAATAVPQAKAGKIRALAVTTARRSAALPDLPTVAETGLPGYEADNWYGFVTVANTPAAIISRYHAELTRALNAADVRQALTNQGLDVRTSSSQEFGAYMKSEFTKWAKVIKAAGISAN